MIKNKRGESEAFFFLFLILVVGAVYILANSGSEPEPIIDNSSTLKIANWNLQIFGDSKVDLIPTYAEKIKAYDIIFIQEIRDIDGSSFNLLCNSLPEYNCQVSSRAGRTSSKEQYGIIYKKGISLTIIDYNPDSQDRWERPPIVVNLSSYMLTLVNIHIKPDDVQKELEYLEEIVGENNTIILGDLNADCDYYNPLLGTEFDSWNWIISDIADTTVGATNCAYDRIIVSKNINIKNYGIYTNVTAEESDHYLVWVEV